jgi:hypothetical protein
MVRHGQDRRYEGTNKLTAEPKTSWTQLNLLKVVCLSNRISVETMELFTTHYPQTQNSIIPSILESFGRKTSYLCMCPYLNIC